jgi:hypothetical protein
LGRKVSVTFFFYGSLMDRDLLEVVLGGRLDHLAFAPGWLDGYAARVAAGYTFPTLVRAPGARVDGILTSGFAAHELDRIAYFEDSEYAPVVHEVMTSEAKVRAHVYLGAPTLGSTEQPWDFKSWRRRDKPLLLAVTRKVMTEHYGITPFHEIDAVWHRLKKEIEAEMKAAAALAAGRPRQGAKLPIRGRAAARRRALR